MYRVLIVEDTPAEADALRGFLERYAAEKGLELGIEVLGSALEFIDLRRTADLVLMDIGMPGINGMEAAQIMRGYDTQTPLIFVTNLAQYAVRGYSVDALDFVVKPVEYHDFAMRLDRALRIMARNARSTMALPTEDGIAVVACSDILYVDMLKHDVRYHLSDGRVLRERGTMRAVAEKLRADEFLKISSGCLVNMGRIVRVGSESVTVSDGAELFFSRSQKRPGLEKLANFIGRSI